MKTITTPEEIQRIANGIRREGKTIGLVPTMGWFHDGHLALMRKAREMADCVITTLFISPIQFGENEDLDQYPHDLERDQALAKEVGVDYLYAPEKSRMYPEGFASNVHVSGLSKGLCGASRPGHFDGVATVLVKLFNQTLPHFAIFGEKDFQQLAVINKMVDDLNFPIAIIGHPIVREKSGLAMSSRNTYLQESEMEAALSLSRAISASQKLAAKTKDVREILSLIKEKIISYKECRIDYVEIVDSVSLEPCLEVNSSARLLLAVFINNRIRLIDNAQLLTN